VPQGWSREAPAQALRIVAGAVASRPRAASLPSLRDRAVFRSAVTRKRVTRKRGP